ncbi:MAG: beta-phosphoglucomutase family hydrolase [Saprospiraceae bacterium]|nr:beta-phosphoglucomutase family hydrolase [Saprospiraceae bacterium]
MKGCIFDLDGVVVETTRYHCQSWSAVASQLGFELSGQRCLELRSLSRMACLEKILEWGGLYMTEAEKLHWCDVKNNWYVDLIAGMRPDEVLPGVLFFLHQLRQEGVKIALTSSSRNAKRVLENTRLDTFFDVVIDGNFTRKGKPDPECFLNAASMLDLKPGDCWVFEDSRLGIFAALQGGFTVIGVGDKDDLSEAHLIISGFKNLTINDIYAGLSLHAT